MIKTSKGLRLHIGIFGKRNAGKSALLNALVRQQVSIVSDVRGTTTDPVEKPMELLPLGPVLFIDTAGIDDDGILGEKRVAKTSQVLDRTDMAIIITENNWSTFEKGLYADCRKRKIPVIAVSSKTDSNPVSKELVEFCKREKLPHVATSVINKEGIAELRNSIIANAPETFLHSPKIVGDLIPSGELAVLVVPIDLEAPKGRLILPQVQTIRDVLDNESYCMIVKDRDLKKALNGLKKPPSIVITDSQAFLEVAKDTPEDIPMTSFSILFARLKGDLNELTKGLAAIEKLKDGDKVLVAEACTHHPVEDDIGRIKIPKWLREYTGAKLEFITTQGHDFPDDLSEFSLVIQCGSCMWNRREVLTRMMKCQDANVPMTNYGLTIAYSLGICERALKPFPDAFHVLMDK